MHNNKINERSTIDECSRHIIVKFKIKNEKDLRNEKESILDEYDFLSDSWDSLSKAISRALISDRNETEKKQKEEKFMPAKKRDIPQTVSAPYRFISVEDRVIPGAVIDINIPQPDHLSASIAVTWKAESPLLIGETRTETIKGKEPQTVIAPFTLGGECNYAIPGASLRGMIRAAVETVAMARLSPINGHHRYGLRDFTHPKYKQLSKEDEVQAGWLSCNGDPEASTTKWKINTAVKWGKILIDDILSANGDEAINRKEWLKKDIFSKNKIVNKNKLNRFKFPNGVSNGEICTIGSSTNGTLVFSGAYPISDEAWNQYKNSGENGTIKKYEYVFVDDPESVEIELTPAITEQFRRLNSKPSANKPVPDGSYRDFIPDLTAGKPVPVFYTGDPRNPEIKGSRFALGFTRLFKVPHEHSVEQVLHAGHRAHKINEGDQHTPDFVENLFGYVIELQKTGAYENARITPANIARQGRVAFGIATLVAGERPRRTIAYDAIMMGPRPSFAPFYLASPSGEDLDYSYDKPVALAGRKRYLPRFMEDEKKSLSKVKELIGNAKKGTPENKDIECRLKFLVPAEGKRDITFTSTIRLTNVSEAELGAVLFALTHGGCLSHSGTQAETPFRHMIGHAKPFGAGQVKVEAADVSVEWNNKAGKETQVDHRRFLEAFQAHMRSNGVTEFPATPSLREFLGASCPAETAKIAEDNLRYMTLPEHQTVKKAYTACEGKLRAPLKDTNGTALIEKPATRLLPAPSYTIPS